MILLNDSRHWGHILKWMGTQEKGSWEDGRELKLVVGTNLRPPQQATHPFFVVLSGENRLGSSDCIRLCLPLCCLSLSPHLPPSALILQEWYLALIFADSRIYLGIKKNVFSKWTWQWFSKSSKLRTLKKLMAFFFEDLRMSVPLILAFILGEGGKNIKGLISIQWANRNSRSVSKFMNKTLCIISVVWIVQRLWTERDRQLSTCFPSANFTLASKIPVWQPPPHLLHLLKKLVQEMKTVKIRHPWLRWTHIILKIFFSFILISSHLN